MEFAPRCRPVAREREAKARTRGAEALCALKTNVFDALLLESLKTLRPR